MKSLKESLFDNDLVEKDLSEHEIALSIIKNYLDKTKVKYDIIDNSVEDTYIKIKFDKPQSPVGIYSWSTDIKEKLLKNKISCSSVGNDSKTMIIRFHWSLDESLNESLFDDDLVSKDNAFIDVITFLSKVFNEWKYKYEFEYSEKYRWVNIIFKRKISDDRCAKLCAELNSMLQWSRFDKDYTCRWGNTPGKNSFIITIYKKPNKTE